MTQKSESKTWQLLFVATLLCLPLLYLNGQVRPTQPNRQVRSRDTIPPSWVLPVIHGVNLRYELFESKSAGTKVSYLVYLPSDYEKSNTNRYPVIYWLHGIGGSQVGVPRFVERFDKAIQDGKTPSAIVVFVNGMKDSFYCDSWDGKVPVESMIIKDLIPYIDNTYRTITLREGRMIEGFSMGGFGAAHLGFKYPELFGSISIIDGALLDVQTIKTRHPVQFERIFGGKEKQFEKENPRILAEKNIEKIRDKTVIRFAVGQLVEGNTSFHDQLTKLKIIQTFNGCDNCGHNQAAIYDNLGDKNWDFYRIAFDSVRFKH
jgi:enterochelin esterase-like enzyme